MASSSETPIDSPESQQLDVEGATLYESRWKSRWVVLGLVILAWLRAVSWLDTAWVLAIPVWVWILVATGPHLYFWLYPYATRMPPPGRTSAATRWLVDAGIAIPVTLLLCGFAAVLEWVVQTLSPGTTTLHNDLATVADPVFVSLMLLYSFTFVPLAEEVFFRGFIQSAFQVRMPWGLAAISQSLIFGFAHSYSVAHSCAAVLTGFVLTLLYTWRKTLLLPVLVHAGVNLCWAIGIVLLMMQNAERPVLGVHGDPQAEVCVIREVTRGSGADAAGIQVGDIIIDVNAHRIRNYQKLLDIVPLYRPGDTLPVRIRRGEATFVVDVTLMRSGDLENSR